MGFGEIMQMTSFHENETWLFCTILPKRHTYFILNQIIMYVKYLRICHIFTTYGLCLSEDCGCDTMVIS